MRRQILAANWKMNKRSHELVEYFRDFQTLAPTVDGDAEIIFAVPYVYLEKTAQLLAKTTLKVSAQNAHWEKEGAFTGEISLGMLKDVGVKTTLIGHSERRQYFAETDETCGKKLISCEKEGIRAIFCVGETLEERDSDLTKVVVESQITKALQGASDSFARSLVIAYEPVWAIGTGRSATADMAQEVHAFIRQVLRDRFGAEAADGIPILYGGSMKPANAKELLDQPDVDGGLVGGASLSAKDFSDLVRVFMESLS